MAVDATSQGKPGAKDRSNGAVFAQIEEDARLFSEMGLYETNVAEHTERWGKRYAKPRGRIVGDDGKANREVLENFHRLRILVTDSPKTDINTRNPLKFLNGQRRGEREVLNACLQTLKKNNLLKLLRRYPTPPVGNPIVFERLGCRLTQRWFRSIYMIGLLKRVLGDRLPKGCAALDIGGAYGNFASLVHQEFPGSRNVIVDLPDQLLLGRYFLSHCFPEAKIAGIQELSAETSISRDFVERYDFILCPPVEYAKFAGGAVDLVSSIGALGEVKREFFDYYVNAPVMREAKYLFFVNPVDSREMFPDCDLTVMDYPVLDLKTRLHFAVSEAFDHAYTMPKSRWPFLYQLRKPATFFEYIGEV